MSWVDGGVGSPWQPCVPEAAWGPRSYLKFSVPEVTLPASPFAPPHVGVLALAQVGELTFDAVVHRGPAHQVYGGQLVASALMAASRTVPPSRTAHSLHSQFVDRGDPAVPIRYHVTCTRDGGTFAARQVEARQEGRLIFTQSCSFQEPGPGPAHQVPHADSLPDPLSLATTADRVQTLDERTRRWWQLMEPMFPLEVRFLDEPARARIARGERVPPRERFYVRLLDRIEDHPVHRDAALAYLTDLFLLSAGVLPHRLLVGSDVTLTSLDHAIWFHGQVPVGEWLLHDVEAPWAGAGRALARGHLFAPDGGLVATTMQEGLIRTVR